MLRAVTTAALVLAAFCLGLAAAPYVLDGGPAPIAASAEEKSPAWRKPHDDEQPPALVVDIKSRHAIFYWLTDGAGNWWLRCSGGGPRTTWRAASAIDVANSLRYRRQPYAPWTPPASMLVLTNADGEWMFQVGGLP